MSLLLVAVLVLVLLVAVLVLILILVLVIHGTDSFISHRHRRKHSLPRKSGFILCFED